VIAAARRAGFGKNAVKKARGRIKAKSERTGFGRDAFYTWMLMDSMDSQFQKQGTHGTHEESMASDQGDDGQCPHCDQPLATPNLTCIAREWHSTESAT
jgi:hypothetical protein